MSECSPVASSAVEILDSLLGYLGFPVEIDCEESREVISLQVFSREAELLIGKRGERLDDLQYLVSRLLGEKFSGESLPKLRVDVEHYRTMKEEKFLSYVQDQAESVKRTGKAVTLRPLNAYFRRLAHEQLKEEAGISTKSESVRGGGKLKRIRIMPDSP